MRLVSNLALATAALATAMVSSAGAVTVDSQTYSGSFPATISGTLPSADTILEESFTLPTTSDLWVQTTSYATGGFQPNLTLYTSGGTYEASNSPQPPTGATADPKTGFVGDTYLSDPGLMAGNYILTLSDMTLSAGLNATNPADLTASGFSCAVGGCAFSDVNGNSRTGAYSLNITATPTGGSMSATPEPATLLLLLPAFGLLFLMRKRISVN